EYEQWKRHDGVREPSDDAIDPAAEKTRHYARNPAKQKYQRHRKNRDGEVEAGRYDHAAHNVTAQLIGAEPVRRRWRLISGISIACKRIVGRDQRPENR